MPMNNKTMRPKKAAAAVVTYNAEALAWQTAAEAAGGTVSASTLSAVSTFCDAIDAAGIRSKFLRLNLVCGGNLAAARTPLYRGASAGGTKYGGTTDTNNGPFVSGDYSESAGITGNGTSKYFDTGLTLGTLKTFGAEYSDVHISVYNRSTSGVSGPSFGGMDPWGYLSGNGCMLDSSGTAGFGDPMYFSAGSGSYGDHDLRGTTFSRGLHFAQFSSSTSGVYEINDSGVTGSVLTGSPVAFGASDSMPLWFAAIYIFEDAEVGYYPYYSAQTLASYSVGKSLTSGQRTAFNAAMQAFQTAMGRNV